MKKCVECGSTARPLEVWEGVIKINHRGNLSDYDAYTRFDDQCPNCSHETEVAE